MRTIFIFLLLFTLNLAYNKDDLKEFYGTWILSHDEGLDEFLVSESYGWFMRRLIRMTTITKTFEAGEGNSYHYMLSTRQQSLRWTFELGKSFTETYLDNRLHNITFSYNRAKNALIETHVYINNQYGKEPLVLKYRIINGTLRMKLPHKKITCYRYFVRE